MTFSRRNFLERSAALAAAGFTTGSCNMNAVTASGDLASITTTSGISYKIPSRAGDSPIIGAGQYCDNTVGAAGSTGRGESNLMACGAMLAVEFMRKGAAPEVELVKVMERVLALSEKRLLDDKGRPRFDLNFYAVAKDGRFAGACAYEGNSLAVCDEQGPRLAKSAFLFKASERPARYPRGRECGDLAGRSDPNPGGGLVSASAPNFPSGRPRFQGSTRILTR